MNSGSLHELNQRYIRLTDRCRSQWTFYQFLQGVFKHLQGSACPVEIDYPGLFTRLRELARNLGSPNTDEIQAQIMEIGEVLDEHARSLLRVDVDISPSLLRRFFDRLRVQDEKVLLAVVKFYLDTQTDGDDAFDKIDILLTRLAEIPREDGHSLLRERHELERIVQPLLQHIKQQPTDNQEMEILLGALTDLRAEVKATKKFSDLASGGALDRFRTLKRRLADKLLHPKLLPAVLETTVAIKNRFRELWEDEEPSLLDDTNRVLELRRQLAEHPEAATPELRDAMERFASAHQRFDAGRQAETLRREDALELRRTLNQILDRFDRSMETTATGEAEAEVPPEAEEAPPDPAPAPASAHEPTTAPHELTSEVLPHLPPDPLLQEYLSKIMFVLELVGRDRPAAEAVDAKEMVGLRLEPWEVEAGRRVAEGAVTGSGLADERERLYLQGAALRIRLDEEAKEIDRLSKRGSDRLPDVLEKASQTLERGAETERRFQWFIDDALYRGETDFLEPLYRSRFRLLRAYSGLWLIHNERGGISPL